MIYPGYSIDLPLSPSFFEHIILEFVIQLYEAVSSPVNASKLQTISFVCVLILCCVVTAIILLSTRISVTYTSTFSHFLIAQRSDAYNKGVPSACKKKKCPLKWHLTIT